LQLLQAGASRLEIVQGFWASAEHRGLEVDGYYNTYLHRQADPSGRASWVAALEGGMNESDVILAFLMSPEYMQAHPDPDWLIRALYADVLGRTVEPAGLSYWEGIAEIPVGGRLAVIEGISNSAEADLRIVDQYYAAYLHRRPDAQGQAFWLQLLQSGSASQDVVAEFFLASDEFFAQTVR
jgi:hypothetical protein